ncbi:MAG: hypothetical protein KC592_06280 [Nitrospira sp.]|nr:hypothetical protein [Nitrospira sp.]
MKINGTVSKLEIRHPLKSESPEINILLEENSSLSRCRIMNVKALEAEFKNIHSGSPSPIPWTRQPHLYLARKKEPSKTNPYLAFTPSKSVFLVDSKSSLPWENEVKGAPHVYLAPHPWIRPKILRKDIHGQYGKYEEK